MRRKEIQDNLMNERYQGGSGRSFRCVVNDRMTETLMNLCVTRIKI